jgi:hypothetical protein
LHKHELYIRTNLNQTKTFKNNENIKNYINLFKLYVLDLKQLNL